VFSVLTQGTMLCVRCNFVSGYCFLGAPFSLENFRRNEKLSEGRPPLEQCCQMVCFQTKNPDLGKFWKVLQWTTLVFLWKFLPNLSPIGIFYGHLVHSVVFWYIFSRFGMLRREKSGNPVLERSRAAV
jgi:hypothetical protein